MAEAYIETAFLEAKESNHLVCNGSHRQLFHNRIDDTLARAVGRKLTEAPHIISVDLSYNNITDYGFQQLLQPLVNPTCALSELRLCYNQLTSAGAGAVATALQPASKDLDAKPVALDFMGNAIGDKGVASLATAIAAGAPIVSLSLGRCDITTNGLKSLAAVLRQPSMLQYLSVSSSSSLSGAYDLLQALADNPTLRSLDLSRCPWVDDDAGRAIARYAWEHPNLVALDLTATKLGSPGIAALAEWIGSDPPLQVLRLDRTRVCDAAPVLATALRQNMTLEALSLVNAEISADGLCELLHALLEAPALQAIAFWGNDWSPAAAELAVSVQAALAEAGRVLVWDISLYQVDGVWQVARKELHDE